MSAAQRRIANPKYRPWDGRGELLGEWPAMYKVFWFLHAGVRMPGLVRPLPDMLELLPDEARLKKEDRMPQNRETVSRLRRLEFAAQAPLRGHPMQHGGQS